ncbi:MAG: SdpI family protein [Syntrophomonadaceae bacterium]|nr:SdpI family protein [Syntrophomonadaceae bacterium]
MQESNYRLDWDTVKQDWPLWLVMAGLLLAAVLVYPHLPAKVPGHWNIHGEIDAYYPKSFGAFFEPLMVIAVYLLMLFTPLIDPKRNNYLRFAGAYRLLRWAVVLCFGLLYAATILVALGYPVNVALLVKASVAMLFIITGNFMSQFRHNYFVGIKTPWTLASEEVWQRTHRMGARIWVAGGLICLATAPVQASWGAYVFFIAVLVMVMVPMVYSYVVFHKLHDQTH